MISKSQVITKEPAEITAARKEIELRRLMRESRRVLVAYSGGVDSTYLAFIAAAELGSEALCVMGDSASVSEFQRGEAAKAAASGRFKFITVPTFELESTEYSANPTNRCYFCKSELYGRLTAIASERAIETVLDGTNADDLADHRPGRRAAHERNIRSPLAELGFTKSDIREQSRVHGLISWDKPASPCLSSRVAYGVPVTIRRLSRIEKGETILRREGFREFRVRDHDGLARIEIGQAELAAALDVGLLDRLDRSFKELGFRLVTLDLGGFRSGSMNARVPAVTDEGSIQKGQLENV